MIRQRREKKTKSDVRLSFPTVVSASQCASAGNQEISELLAHYVPISYRIYVDVAHGAVGEYGAIMESAVRNRPRFPSAHAAQRPVVKEIFLQARRASSRAASSIGQGKCGGALETSPGYEGCCEVARSVAEVGNGLRRWRRDENCGGWSYWL